VRGGGWSRRGAFVTIEGPEGAGKTTQAERLRRAAEDAGIETVLVREPGGTVVGERVRAILLDPASVHAPRTDALLFNAARAQLVRDVIRPALTRDALVISTRFADSTLAYQGYGGGLPLDELQVLEAFATERLRPDLTILLDLAAEVGLGRKASDTNRFESAFGLDFHRRVRDGFLALAAAEPERFSVVDASAPPDDVAAAVIASAARLDRLRSLEGEPTGDNMRIPT
jgi:dTMP kinase